ALPRALAGHTADGQHGAVVRRAAGGRVRAVPVLLPFAVSGDFLPAPPRSLREISHLSRCAAGGDRRMEGGVPLVPAQADDQVSPAAGVEIAAAHGAHPPAARNVSGGPLRSHPPRSVRRLPLVPALLRHRGLVYLPPAA